MLRDRLTCGLLDICIRHRLIAETKKKFQELLELTPALEVADKNSKDLLASNPHPFEAAVQEIQRQRHPPRGGPRLIVMPTYNRCGARSHKANDCNFKDAVCYHCKEVGRLARVHYSKKTDKLRRTHQLLEEAKQTEGSATNTPF